jgi:hypothetical protein
MPITARGQIRSMISLTLILIRTGRLKLTMLHAEKIGRNMARNSSLLVIKTWLKMVGSMQFGEVIQIPQLGMSRISLF